MSQQELKWMSQIRIGSEHKQLHGISVHTVTMVPVQPGAWSVCSGGLDKIWRFANP